MSRTSSQSIERTRKWVPASALCAGVLLALALHYRPVAQDESPVPVPGDFHLKAEPDGTNTRLLWDPVAEGLKGASAAFIDVFDGNTHTALRLTPGDLRNGSVEWRTASPDARFVLRVEQPGEAPRQQTTTLVKHPYPINSSSDNPKPKPTAPAAASVPAGEASEAVTDSPRAITVPARPLATQAQHPGRMKRIYNSVSAKASHLWPFHSAKPEQRTR